MSKLELENVAKAFGLGVVINASTGEKELVSADGERVTMPRQISKDLDKLFSEASNTMLEGCK